jgi:hypothetical protein
MGTWEHIKLGKLPWHNSLGFFCWGVGNIPQNTHRNKKGVVYDIVQFQTGYGSTYLSIA